MRGKIWFGAESVVSNWKTLFLVEIFDRRNV